MEKSYQPTAKRLRKSVEEGESVDAAFFRSGTLLLGTMIGLYFCGLSELQSFGVLLQHGLAGDVTAEFAIAQALRLLVWVVIVPLTVGGSVTIAGWLFLNGLRWSPQLVGIQGKRLVPTKFMSTVQRLPRVLMHRLCGLLSLIALLGGVYQCAAPEAFSAASLIQPEGIQSWLGVLAVLARFTVTLVVVGIVLSGILGWKRYRNSLMMSRDEVMREQKEEEGDPELKHARRSMQHQLAYAELRERIKGSRVVVVSRSKQK